MLIFLYLFAGGTLYYSFILYFLYLLGCTWELLIPVGAACFFIVNIIAINKGLLELKGAYK